MMMWQLFGIALGVMFGMIGLALVLLVIGFIVSGLSRLRHRHNRHECPQCHAFRGELWEVLTHQGEEHDYP